MKVHWTKTAEEHLGAIHAYIALDSPEHAKHMVDKLTKGYRKTVSYNILYKTRSDRYFGCYS